MKRLCSGAGCGRAIPEDERYCAECQPAVAVSDGIKQHRDGGLYNAELDKQNQSKRWHTVRGIVLRKQPMCNKCQLAISEICDHIVPAAVAVEQARASGRYPYDKWAGYYLQSNLQGLCRSCHGTKTNEDKRHDGDWPDVVAKEAAAPKKVWSF
jgi:hypothetical protein